MSHEDSTTEPLHDIVTVDVYVEAAKKLDYLLQQCESFGIYDGAKSLAQMRYELSLAKDKTDIRRLLQ